MKKWMARFLATQTNPKWYMSQWWRVLDIYRFCSFEIQIHSPQLCCWTDRFDWLTILYAFFLNDCFWHLILICALARHVSMLHVHDYDRKSILNSLSVRFKHLNPIWLSPNYDNLRWCGTETECRPELKWRDCKRLLSFSERNSIYSSFLWFATLLSGFHFICLL